MDVEFTTAIAGAAAAVGYVIKELVVRNETRQIAKRTGDHKSGNNGNGKLTAEDLITHTKICGGRIEAKIDTMDEKMDDHIHEIRRVQQDQWTNMAKMQDAIATNAKDIGIQSQRLVDHLQSDRGRG